MNTRQQRVVQWAHARLTCPDKVVILDTETTHLEGEIVDIAILDLTGKVLLESLIRPTQPVMESARAIHGISDEELATAPSFMELWPGIYARLSAFDYIITYNAPFDRARLHTSVEMATEFTLFTGKSGARYAKLLAGSGRQITPLVLPAEWECLMEQYALYHGERSRGSFRSQKLASACQQLSIEHATWHRARGDAEAALKVLRALASQYDEESVL